MRDRPELIESYVNAVCNVAPTLKAEKCSRFAGVQFVRKESGMDTEPTITLQCVRKEGRRETTKLAHQTLADARELARFSHRSSGLAN